MNDLDNILLYEQTPAALEAVRSGDAIISAGGIRRKGDSGKGFLEQAQPAVMSVADFQSLFEGKEHALETDEHLRKLDSKLCLSTESLREIEHIEWMNNALIQRTYTITYEGFCQTLSGIETIVNHVSELERYIRRRDSKELSEKAQTYVNYMRTDVGHMLSQKYSVVNGNIAEHLDRISAFAKKLLSEIEDMEEDNILQIQILCSLVKPFTYVIRRYSALYYYENDGELMPGDYEEWVNTLSSISKSAKFRDKLEYYIKLHTTLPYKEKLQISREISKGIFTAVSNVKFDHNYIKTHSKQEYLSMGDQIRKKFENKDYFIEGSNIIIFLDRNEQ